MSTLTVTHGTAAGNKHLCKTCSWGQYTTGYRESDLLVICMRPDLSRVVPFVVHKCTEYQYRTHPDWEQMKELAIPLKPSRKSTTGFLGTGGMRRSIEEEEEALAEMGRY